MPTRFSSPSTSAPPAAASSPASSTASSSRSKRSIASTTAASTRLGTCTGRCRASGSTCCRGLKAASKLYPGQIASVGVDTWGVDFALLDKNDEMLGIPHHYRDRRTDGHSRQSVRHRPARRNFPGDRPAVHGVQHALSAAGHEAGQIAAARDRPVVFDDARPVPLAADRHQVQRSTNASTTQFLNPQNRRLGRPTCSDRFGLPTADSGQHRPARHAARQNPTAVAEDTGLASIDVIVPGTHDTASAVAAVPPPANPAQSPTGATSAAAPGR